MSTPTNDNGKLQGMIEKWGAKSAMLLLCLCAWVYQQDRGALMADNKALSARIGATERAIGRLQEGKASREELKSAIETFQRDAERGRNDFKDAIQGLRNDLVERMDIIAKQRQ